MHLLQQVAHTSIPAVQQSAAYLQMQKSAEDCEALHTQPCTLSLAEQRGFGMQYNPVLQGLSEPILVAMSLDVRRPQAGATAGRQWFGQVCT